MNADGESVLEVDYEHPLQYNMYTYCWNNSVAMVDYIGDWPTWSEAFLAIGAIAAVAAVAVVAVVAAPVVVGGAVATSSIAAATAIATDLAIVSSVAVSTSILINTVETVTAEDSISYYKEHTKNRTPSNKNKHDKGNKRRSTDQGGEKGDARRTPRNGRRNRSQKYKMVIYKTPIYPWVWDSWE